MTEKWFFEDERTSLIFLSKIFLSFSSESRGQAHFSATTLGTEHAITRRKTSQTPACEHFRLFYVEKPDRAAKDRLRFERLERGVGVFLDRLLAAVAVESRSLITAQVIDADGDHRLEILTVCKHHNTRRGAEICGFSHLFLFHRPGTQVWTVFRIAYKTVELVLRAT